MFMERLKVSRELPKTASPSLELFKAEFDRLVPLEEAILCIHPSSEVSGTVRSALVAARDFAKADIRVNDSRLIAVPLATLVRLAVSWAEDGLETDLIEARLKELIPRCRVYFLVATLEYLARRGRIGGASALLGGKLQIRPILILQDGRVQAAGATDQAVDLAAALGARLGVDNIPLYNLPPAIVMHGGPGVIGVRYFI